MANKARIKKAAPGKYAGREYLDYDEAGDYLGMKRATLFNYMKDLEIKSHKFIRDSRHYLAMEDVERIEKVAVNPWLAGKGVTPQAIRASKKQAGSKLPAQNEKALNEKTVEPLVQSSVDERTIAKKKAS